MTKIVKEHNATTGEIIEREMTADEIADLETDRAKAQADLAAETAKAAEKAALLAKLGINAQEAALLLA